MGYYNEVPLDTVLTIPPAGEFNFLINFVKDFLRHREKKNKHYIKYLVVDTNFIYLCMHAFIHFKLVLGKQEFVSVLFTASPPAPKQ